MREKVTNLVYLDSERYISIDSIEVLPWGTILLPFFVIVTSIAKHWPAMIIVTCVYFFSSLILISVLRSGKIQKTFRLRFLVNGIVSVYIFAALLLPTLVIAMAVESSIMYWLLPAIGVFVAFYICLIVYMVHINGFKYIRKAKMNRKFQKISAVAGMLLPAAGSIGFFLSRSVDISDTVPLNVEANVVCVVMSFVLIGVSLGFIGFVQYFYAVKYDINCDESGKNCSLLLESLDRNDDKKHREINTLAVKQKKQMKTPNRRKLIVRIVCILVAIPIVCFLILLLIGILLKI